MDWLGTSYRAFVQNYNELKVLLQKFNNSIMRELGDMEKWNRWSLRAKEFMKSVGDKANLEAVVSEYSSKVIELHGWLSKKVAEAKAVPLSELDELQERLRNTGV